MSWFFDMSFKHKAITVIATLIVLGIAWQQISYRFAREWNYSRAYESKVEVTAQEQICRMVKPEYLVNPEAC